MQNKTQREVWEHKVFSCVTFAQSFFFQALWQPRTSAYISKEQQHPLWSTTKPSMLLGHSWSLPTGTGELQTLPSPWGLFSRDGELWMGRHSRQLCEWAGSTGTAPLGAAQHPWGTQRGSPGSFSPSRIDITINCERFIVHRLLTVIFFLLTKSRSSL